MFAFWNNVSNCIQFVGIVEKEAPKVGEKPLFVGKNRYDDEKVVISITKKVK